MAADVPTAGSAMRVAVAAPFLNARGERDSDKDNTNDDWTSTGSGTFHKRKGAAGLSSSSATWIYAPDGGTITLITPPDVIPVGSDLDVQAELVFYATKVFSALQIYADADLKIYTSNNALQSTASANDFGASWPSDSSWARTRISVSDFVDKSNLDSSRATLTFEGNSPALQLVLDAPVLGWRADGADDSDRWYVMESRPSGASVVPGMTGSMTRDSNGGMFYADPHGATSKWKLSLNYEYMSDADYQYWCACYAVNRGTSGYMNASGGQLAPQPIAVEHFLFGTAGIGDDGMAKPPIIVGNITSFDLRVREYLGFGYQGSITIEEA